jgi:hypothetical protein
MKQLNSRLALAPLLFCTRQVTLKHSLEGSAHYRTKRKGQPYDSNVQKPLVGATIIGEHYLQKQFENSRISPPYSNTASLIWFQ